MLRGSSGHEKGMYGSDMCGAFADNALGILLKCVGYVLEIFQACVGDALAMSWTWSGHVSDMCCAYVYCSKVLQWQMFLQMCFNVLADVLSLRLFVF